MAIESDAQGDLALDADDAENVGRREDDEGAQDSAPDSGSRRRVPAEGAVQRQTVA